MFHIHNGCTVYLRPRRLPSGEVHLRCRVCGSA